MINAYIVIDKDIQLAERVYVSIFVCTFMSGVTMYFFVVCIPVVLNAMHMCMCVSLSVYLSILKASRVSTTEQNNSKTEAKCLCIHKYICKHKIYIYSCRIHAYIYTCFEACM